MKKMPGTILLEEVEWQLSFGMHPIFIAEQLKKTPEAIKKAAERHNNRTITIAFTSEVTRQRNKREAR